MQIKSNENILIFNLLGPPTVLYEGRILNIPRRQVRTLLYLLASQNQPLPYQTLHHLFWSNEPESTCRRNLSHLFTHIRNSLPTKDLLILSSVSANLNPDIFWSDVIEFTRLCNQPAIEENFADFIRADQLYRGSYLEGKYLPRSIELDKHIDQKRMHLEMMYLKNLSNLVILNKNIKNYSKALEYAETFLRMDSFNEDIFSELLILYSLMGNNSKAIERYQVFSKDLKTELNINPSLKTKNLFSQIKASISEKSDLNLSEDSTIDQHSSSKIKFSDTNYQAFMKIMNSKGGLGGIALVTGEIGMGKAELISNFMSQNYLGKINLRIICTPATQKIRYFPFRDLASKLISNKDQGIINSHLISTYLNNIAAQLSKPVQIQSTITDEVIEIIMERDFSLIQELFQELVNLPVAITLSIENLEWIDEDSLEMILYLSEKHVNNPIAIICSYCCQKEEKVRTFEQNAQVSPAYLGTIQMEEVKIDDIKSKLEELFGAFPESHRISKQLLQLTGGNPFYISEILTWMKVSKWSAQQLARVQTFEIPQAIKQKILARFERFSKNEKKILEYAAVKGSSSSFDEIKGHIKLSYNQTHEAIDDLICRNLLGHDGDAYFVKYEIVRQSILFNLNATQKQMYEKLLSEPISD